MTANALASIIIPIAPQHAAIAQRAIASASAQTVPVEVIPVVDDAQRGAAWARNRGIEQADTDYVVFLDADDWLMPTFVERAWTLHQQTGRYVYTDFLEDNGKHHDAPECPWVNESWHAVTALVPTAWAREVDGFDEALREGGEDSEFFMHLCSIGHCGTRLPEALFVYTNAPDGRSKRWRGSAAHAAYDAMMLERYINRGKTAMGCCTEPAKKLEDPNAPAPNMVLVRPRWGGNRRERGLKTGTLYPPADRSQVIEIDARDAAARPDHWDIVSRPPAPMVIAAQPPAPYPPIAELGKRVLGVRQPPPTPPPPPPPADVVASTPDVGRVTRLAQKFSVATQPSGWQQTKDGLTELYWPPPVETASRDYLPTVPPVRPVYDSVRVSAKSSSDPVFVIPDKDYPSYTDVRRLVELSGFEAETSFAAYDSSKTYIFLSPEQPESVGFPSWEGIKARVIWWSLEYGGEYEPDLSDWRGEVWASDPAWARRHGAKFVVMGSHPRLCADLSTQAKLFDYITLAYQTPRRTQIDQRLNDLNTPAEPYPGYGDVRHRQLVASKLMLHVHQRDDAHAIAPQRIALAAAYKLPLICEAVPEPGEYERYLPFIQYANLEGEVRSQLAMYEMGMPQQRAERLHDWLCNELTFRKSVEAALK